MLELVNPEADNGNCRVYYKARRGKKPLRMLFCWQLCSRADMPPNFELLVCSNDGEPGWQVRHGSMVTTEPPKGDELIEHELRAFLESRGLTHYYQQPS